MKFFISLISLFLLINLNGPDPVDFIISLALIFVFIITILKGKIRRPNMKISLFFLIFLTGYVFSIFFNTYSSSYVMNFFINLALFFLILKTANSEESVRKLFLWLTIGATLTGFLALISISFDVLLLPNQFKVIVHDRYLGMFGDPNIFGAFLVFLFFYWLNQTLNSNKNSLYVSFLPVFFTFILLIQIIATSSRSSAGGLLLGSLVYLYIFLRSSDIKSSVKKISRFFIPAVFLIGISLVPLYDTVIERATTVVDISDNEDDRFALVYTAAAIMVAIDNPFGVGPGQTNFATGIENADGGVIGSHNAFVQVFADNGWLSGVVLLVVIILLWITSYKNARRSVLLHGVDQIIMIASLTSFIFIGMFQDLIQWKVVWVFFGILVSMHNSSPRYS